MPSFDGEQQSIQRAASPKQDPVSMNSKDDHQGDEEESPPRKKPKVVDVSINGDSFDQTTGEYKISSILLLKVDLTLLRCTVRSVDRYTKDGRQELFTTIH